MKTSVFRLSSLIVFIFAFITHADPPPAPQNVRAAWLSEPYAYSAPFVQWELAPGAESYNIYRADDTNTAWTVVATNVTGPFFSDSWFSFLPSYYFVTAVNGDGESQGSAAAIVTEQYGGMITVDSIDLFYGTLSSSNALVRWFTSLVAGDEGMVEWGPSFDGETNYLFYLINTNYLPGHSFDLTNLSPRTIYQLRLTSIGANRGGVRWLTSFATPDTNHPPVAEDLWYDTFVFPTNGAGITLRGYDSNQPPLQLTFRIVSAPTNGTLSAIVPGWMWNTAYLTYTPAPLARGYDRFQFVVNNGTWDSAPASVTFSNWVNTPPMTTNGAMLATAEDTPILLPIPVFDAEGDPITFEIPEFAGWHGSVTGQVPNVYFIPETNYSGPASFWYRATDGFEESVGWFQIEVTPVNDRPILVTNGMPSIVGYEDGPVQFVLWLQDVDWTGNYEVVQVTPPSHGTISSESLQVTYLGETNFSGIDTFTLAVRESDGTMSEPQTYTVEVMPRDDAPIAFDQDVITLEDTPIAIMPTGYDIDSPVLTFRLRWAGVPAQHGYVEDTGTNFIYHPMPDFHGTDEFEFEAVDDWGLSSYAPGVVSIIVLPVGEPPIASLSWATAHQDAFVNGVFQVSDPDSDSLVCEVVTPPTNGTVTVSGTNFVYTPTVGYQGPDAFSYRAFDGQFYSGVTNVSVWVTGPNGVPEAWTTTVSAAQDTPVWFWLPMSDPDSDPLNGIVVDPPQHGTLVLDGINATYFPGTNFFGTDTFTFIPFDGLTNGNLGTVIINVYPPNRPPVANSSSVNGNEDSPISIGLQASDPDGNTLTFQIVSNPTKGVLTGSGANRTYQPNLNSNGTDSFQFRVSDGQYESSLATVSINVTPVNDAPVATNTIVLAYEDFPVTFVLGGTDVDNSISSCTFTIITPPAHGTLSSGNRVRTYTPPHNYNGPDSFTFQISDGSTVSSIATVSINVQPLNDAPFPQWQVITNYEDTIFPITLTGSDVDGDPLTFGVLTPPIYGSLNGTPPNLIYTPDTNFNSGTPLSTADFIIFWVSDGAITTSNAITIVLLPVNDAPAANAQSFSVPEDGLVLGDFVGTDVDGDALTFRVVTPPGHGVVTLLASNRFEYRPSLDYSGADSFAVVANDGALDSAPATISLNVAGFNDAPVLTNQEIAITEDTVAVIAPTASDPDGDALTFHVIAEPLHGTVEFNGSNFVYRPTPNYNGPDSFLYQAHDNFGGTNTATILITVTAVNDLPVAAGQSVSTVEDMPVNITLGAADMESASLSLRVVSAPANGVLSGTMPNLTYTPNAEFSGIDAFTFIANDGESDGNAATVTISVTAVNDPPVAFAQAVTVSEDQSVAITLAGTDPEGGPLYYMVPVLPDHGFLSGSQSNRVYTPVPHYFGTDTLRFKVYDGTNQSAEATVTITITPVPDAPVVSARNFTVAEDTSLAMTLPANDWDLDPLTIALVAGPAHGTVTGLPGRDVVYTPDPDFNGTDSFTYRASDGTLDSNVGTISINVSAAADAPVAVAQNIATDEDTHVNILLSGVDADNDSLSYSIVSTPTNGTLSGTAPALTYTPSANYKGADSFAFFVSDGSLSSTGTVSISVTPVNDPPVGTGQSLSVDEDGAISILLTGSDVDGDALTYSVLASPGHGTLSGTPPNLTYSPSGNFNGADSFTFQVHDGAAFSAPAVVSIAVAPVNDAPAANSQSVSTPEDSARAITLSGTDVDGTALGYTILAAPTRGVLSGTAPDLTYTPGANLVGGDSFVFVVDDGVLSSTGTVNIAVTPVNDEPAANAQSITVTYNTARVITLTGSDVEGSALTYTIVSTPTNGMLSGTAPNVTYTPNIGSAGADRFTFRVNDGTSNSAAATVSITTQNPSGIPNAPTSLTVTVPTATRTLILNWSCTATNEDGFKIERSLNGSSGWAQIATTGINTHTFTNTGLNSNTRYYYRVRSYNRLGNSAYSNTVNAKAR